MNHLLIKGQDTFVKFLDLPMDVKGFVIQADDCFNIIINSKLSYDTTVKVLKHEIEHIIKNHLSSENEVENIEKTM